MHIQDLCTTAMTSVPTSPEVANVSTNRPSTAPRLKTVPGPRSKSYSVEGPAGVLNQSDLGRGVVGTVRPGTIAVERGQRGCRGDFEGCILAIGPAADGRPLEIPIGG